jgi:hypothetical protein
MMTLQWPCDAAAVADLPDEVVSSTRVVEAAQATSIQVFLLTVRCFTTKHSLPSHDRCDKLG